MRHRISGKKLNRDSSHRKALLRNLCIQLIEHGKISTTLEKAKFMRSHVEKLVTRAKDYVRTEDKVKQYNTVRYLREKLASELAVRKLVTELAKNYESRSGGYTRIIKTGNRDGDNAPTARIEFIKEVKAVKAKNAKK